MDCLQIYSQNDFTERPRQEGINHYRWGSVRDNSAPGQAQLNSFLGCKNNLN